VAIEDLRQKIETTIESDRHVAMHERGLRLLDEISHPGFWDEQEQARRTLSEVYHVERITERFTNLRTRAERLADVAEMIRRHGDVHGVPRLAASYELLARDLALAEMELLAGDDEHIQTDTVFLCVSPHLTPRAREAGDWPNLIVEMYTSWARRKGYEVEAIGDGGGEAILLLRGPGIYALLQGEAGIHKLQRELSGANDHHGRPVTRLHLARVSVLAAPDPAALDATRQQTPVTVCAEEPGRDGKTVQVVEVRSPGGLRVRVRAEHAERLALSLLAARTALAEADPAEDALVVRVYRLARTQYVRDPRTGERSGKPRDVLAGAIDPFLFAYLKQHAAGPHPAPAAATIPTSRSPDRR
jgi:peptide chain release factor 2